MFSGAAPQRPWFASSESVSAAGGVPALLPGAVGFYFSFRAAIVLITVRLFVQDAQTGVAAGLVCDYLLLVVAGFFSLGAASGSLRSMLRGPVWWALAFLGFSGVSLLWSSTASLAAATAFWCAMAADVAIVMLLLRNGAADQTSQSLMQGFIWGTCIFAAIAWLLPAQSDLRLGDEELLGPNQIGYSCAFAFFLAQYLMSRRSRLWGYPAAFLAITLLRTLSKTTLIAFIAAEAFILLRDRSIHRTRKLMLIGLALMVLFAFQGLIASYYTIYTNAGSQAETLTGRLGIWAYFLAESVQQPWAGHGFHSVWKVVPPFGPFEARHAHNELLQQFYAYGAAGIILVTGFYTSVFLQIRRLPDGPVKTVFQGLLIFVLVRGLGDTEPFDLSLPLWFVCLISPVLMQWAAQPRERPPAIGIMSAVALMPEERLL